MSSEVDRLLARPAQWQAEFQLLANLIRSDARLTESIKWGCPCYSLGKHNVVLIHGFKHYCALLFFQGAVLQDPAAALIAQTANTQASRQLRFASCEEITQGEILIKDLLQQAICAAETGLRQTMKSTEEFAVAPEFQQQLDADAALADAFQALTPGRQRAYLLYFSAAKRAQTRQQRVLDHIAAIMAGKGLRE